MPRYKIGYGEWRTGWRKNRDAFEEWKEQLRKRTEKPEEEKD